MSRRFKVPTQVLGDQALKTASLYRDDTEDNRAALAGIGVTQAVIGDVEGLGREVLDFETKQEMMKAETALAKSASVSATRAVIDWRGIDLLPRVQIALKDDSRIAFFRPGKLRSTRASAVIREARLSVDTIRKFVDDPKLALRGVTEELAKKGESLIDRAEVEDARAAQATAAQVIATQDLRKKEATLGSLLQEIERAAAAVFPADSAELNRYRLKVIRNYISTHKSTGSSLEAAKSEAVSPASETQAA
jgi:hypothetical protein